MQKTILTKAIAVAMMTLGASAAMAESSVTLYGTADVSVDNVRRTVGVSQALLPTTKLNTTRVSPSASSQTAFGLKGTEDLGEGLKASFVLEGQLGHDTGALGQDGRIFGRQSYVGLTTPFGELRLGRQYAPIFYSTAMITTERFGATDLFTEGGASNNLMVRQDNQLSYWLKAGGFTGELSYSPNAGSAAIISGARATNSPTATQGQILGGATAGAETAGKTGRAIGLFGAYATSDLALTAGYHQNSFGGADVGVYTGAANSPLTNISLDKYAAYNLGAKYAIPGVGLILSGVYGEGKYTQDNGGDNIKLGFFALGLRMPVGDWAFVAQYSQIKFKNFTHGKDVGVMLGADYALSKRTSLYTRVGQIKDTKGDAVALGAGVGGASLSGGPDVLGVAMGLRETPVFAGAGINADGKSSYVGLGIRHTF